MAGIVTVTYKPTSRACWEAFPSYRGAPVRCGGPGLHASCDGTYRGSLTNDQGTVFDGTPCCCECHAPEGLPDWMRPQEGAALEEALAAEARIQAMTRHLQQAHPVLGPGSLADVVTTLQDSCAECRDIPRQ